MSEVFLKFKKRYMAFRIIKSAMVSLSAGLVGSGVSLALIRLAVWSASPIASAIVGVCFAAVGFTVCFLLTGRSDISLARELDTDFCLKNRVQTMIEFSASSDEMILMQKMDAEEQLAAIPLKAYKFKGFLAYAICLLVCAAVLTVGFLVPDRRGYIPSDYVEPFELSKYQADGIQELIDNLNSSDMEEEFKAPIIEELTQLLDVLKETDTKDGMNEAVIKSMAVILDITHRSSSATEILEGLWDSNDVYLRHLAKALARSSWEHDGWSGFGDEMKQYVATLMGDDETDEGATVGAERVKTAVSGMNGKLPGALAASGIDTGDELYLAIYGMFRNETYGLSLILDGIDGLSDDEVRAVIGSSVDALGAELYSALMLNKTNATEGEEVMAKLYDLFDLLTVPDLKSERPDFYVNDWSVTAGQGGTDFEGDPEDAPGAGGAGGGIGYGSDDLVLDPLTGEIVKYGDIIKKYNEKMYAMLESDLYTEEQKAAIRKYFELLYSGLEKKEG